MAGKGASEISNPASKTPTISVVSTDASSEPPPPAPVAAGRVSDSHSSKPSLIQRQHTGVQTAAPKPEHYFHFMYKILPNEGPVDADIVTFDDNAKLYTVLGSRSTRGHADPVGTRYTLAIR